MNTGLEGLQQSTSVDHDERWVDAVVTESSGSGHIRFSIAGFTDNMPPDLLPQAYPEVLRSNGGSSPNVAGLYPPEKGHRVQVQIKDEHNVVWRHAPFTRNTIPPECDICGEYGKIVYASEDGVVVFHNAATNELYIRNGVGPLKIGLAGDFNLHAHANINIVANAHIDIDGRGGIDLHSPGGVVCWGGVVAVPYGSAPDPDLGAGMRWGAAGKGKRGLEG